MQIVNIINRHKRNNHEKLKILDIGCSDGKLFNLLDKNKIDYLGIEPDINDYELALSRGVNVLNLTVETAIHQLHDNFDYVVLGDVLEHLSNPDEILSTVPKFIKDNGILIISIPNVAHFTNRFSLLFGHWNYKDRGILDKTHLKFWTRATFDKLAFKYFRKKAIFYTPIPLEALPIFTKFIFFKQLDFINYILVKLRPTFFAYQFIYVLGKF